MRNHVRHRVGSMLLVLGCAACSPQEPPASVQPPAVDEAASAQPTEQAAAQPSSVAAQAGADGITDAAPEVGPSTADQVADSKAHPVAHPDPKPDARAAVASTAEPAASVPTSTTAPEPAAMPPLWAPELELSGRESSPQLVKLAQAAERKGRWDAGANNALALYAQVLQQDAEHTVAKDAVQRLLGGVDTRLRAAAAVADWSQARRLLAIVEHFRPGQPETVELSSWLAGQEQLASLLSKARALAAAAQWLPPAEPNALAVYREMLRLAPEHTEALAGLVEVEAAVLAEAVRAADQGQFRAADRLLADAADVRPGSEAVQNASARIMVERTRRTELLLQAAQNALAKLEFATVERLLAEIDAISAQMAGVDELRSRLEVARVYGLLSPGQRFADALRDATRGPEMVVLPVGRFLMGAAEGESGREKSEQPRHEVVIARPFALALTEVSVANFQRFIDASGYRTRADERGHSTIYDERSGRMLERKGINWRFDHAGSRAPPDLPVVHVSWQDARAYADWLSEQTGKAYRLPTEAEFEYALRAGGSSRYPWGEQAPTRALGNFAGSEDRSASARNWVKSFAGYADGFWGPAPTGSFPRNAFGLFDLEGNVSEWVEDCWHESYRRAPTDGSAWVNPGCTRRLGRGASWASAPDDVRAARRINLDADTTNARLGFRVALTLEVPAS